MRAPNNKGILASLIGLIGLACTSPFSVVEVDPEKAKDSFYFRAQKVTGNPVKPEVWDLSDETWQTLGMQNLADLWDAYPELAVRAMDQLASRSGDRVLVVALAEMAHIEGQRLEAAYSAASTGFYLLAAERAQEYLFAPAGEMERAFDPGFDLARRVYQQATSAYVRDLLAETDGRLKDHFRLVLNHTYRVRVDRGASVKIPGRFDELLLADNLAVKGFRYRHRQPGLGVPLVGVRKNPGSDAQHAFYPPEGFVHPLTLVLRFDVDQPPPVDEHALFDDFVARKGQGTAVLSLYDPLFHPTIEIAGKSTPLAADLTAPFALLLERAQLRRLSLQGMLNIEKASARRGIYMLEPYDPDKIPVVMIHGLKSSAHIWAEMTNDLNGDPELRRKFQIWHYLYPSGLPYLYSGRVLREQLEEARRVFDPQGEHPAMQSMILIAHSMGGLLAKTLASSSGDRLWNEVATAPPEAFAGEKRHVDAFTGHFFFEPLPYIDRVVFISTPHRGARMATALVGRLSGALVELPSDIRDVIARVAEANRDFIRPEVRKLLARGGPDSIRALSPRHRALQVLADIPIDPRVTVHTIIGDRDTITGDPGIDSDGVVTHESAHVEGAASEITVPSKHDAYAHPLTILEVKRILREHLQQRQAGP